MDICKFDEKLMNRDVIAFLCITFLGNNVLLGML